MTYFVQLCYKNGTVHNELEQEDDTETATEVRRLAQRLADDPTFEQDFVFVIDRDGEPVGKFVPGVRKRT